MLLWNDGHAVCTGSKRNDYSQPSTLLSPASLVNGHTLRVVIGILLCIAEQYAKWYPRSNLFATNWYGNEKSPNLVHISRVSRRHVLAS